MNKTTVQKSQATVPLTSLLFWPTDWEDINCTSLKITTKNSQRYKKNYKHQGTFGAHL
jgi:hypothetical protein